MRPHGRQPLEQAQPLGVAAGRLEGEARGELDAARKPRRGQHGEIEARKPRVVLVEKIPDTPISEDIVEKANRSRRTSVSVSDLVRCERASESSRSSSAGPPARLTSARSASMRCPALTDLLLELSAVDHHCLASAASVRISADAGTLRSRDKR